MTDHTDDTTGTGEGQQPEQKPTGEVIHFNPWRDFNDAPLQEDPFGIEPDPEQLRVFLDVVFSYCEGLIPVRGFVDTDALDACDREHRMSAGRRSTLLVYRVICTDEDAMHWPEEDMGNLRVALNALVRLFRLA